MFLLLPEDDIFGILTDMAVLLSPRSLESNKLALSIGFFAEASFISSYNSDIAAARGWAAFSSPLSMNVNPVEA